MGLKDYLRIRAFFIRVRTSFWFLPGMMVVGSGLLAASGIYLDATYSFGLADRFPMIFGASSEGARVILATIAGSMITVSGVTFSITIVALSLASNQYSSRILRNFMSDTGTQLVLGMFVSVFVYCVLVLRTIRGGEESFIPSYSLVGGIVFGLVAIGFLIYFVHHIATMIQASTILANIAGETLAVIEDIYPASTSRETSCGEEPRPGPDECNASIAAFKTGYIQDINLEALIKWAVEKNVVLEMLQGIGEFVIQDEPLLKIFGKVPGDPKELKAEFSKYFTLASNRTIHQDPAFGIRQIVDIALKALSPGINDTTTAESCIDYLASILHKTARIHIPSERCCCDQKLRLIARRQTFEYMADEAFHRIRQNAADNVVIYLRLVFAIIRIANPEDPKYHGILTKHIRLIAESAKMEIKISEDAHAFNQALAQAGSKLKTDLGFARL